MAIEQATITNPETKREVISARLQEAFELWYRDSTNWEVAENMNCALDEAYLKGVRFSVNIVHGANGSTPDVNEQVYNKLMNSDPRIQNEIIISTVQDEGSFRINRAKVYAFPNSGYLHLDVIEGKKRLNITNLKPDEMFCSLL